MSVVISDAAKLHMATAVGMLFEDNDSVPTFELVRLSQELLIEAVAEELKK